MASEARAMLDALMGSDRDTSLPVGASASGANDGDIWAGSRGNKKSCYDRDICPLYCAWGVDVFDLFTNTKSDLGQNPYTTQDDAREEFLSLPDHEKDRLGYEHILYRKLGDLVRGCDRIVTRNKDKLRVEVAKAARARGADGNRIDPVTEVKEEVLLETAECMVDLELREEEVAQMVEKLVQLDNEWKELWKKLKLLRNAENDEKENPSVNKSTDQIPIIETESMYGKSENDKKGDESAKEVNHENGTGEEVISKESTEVANKSEIEHHMAKDEETNKVDTKVEVFGNDQLTIKKDENERCGVAITQTAGEEGAEKNMEETKPKVCILDSENIEELMIKLYSVSSEQQKLISSLTTITSQNIMPLRENLQGLQKQLYYIRTDTSSDKTVCEISGNFMSSRDAEERIAAHYAGKQYVGWKMVRDKYRELHLKYNSPGRGPQMTSGQQRGSTYGPRGGQPGGCGPPPGNNGFVHGDRGPPMGYQNGPPGRHDRDRRDRSRSRDRDNYSSRSRSGRGGRHSSPSRWERDRYPSSASGGGSYNYEHGSGRHGGRRDDRGHNRSRY